MDPSRFDGITRWLARPLSRRRLAATVAATVAAAAAARHVALSAAAEACPAGTCGSGGINCTTCTAEPSHDIWIPQCCGVACCNEGSHCAVLADNLCCPDDQRPCQMANRPEVHPTCVPVNDDDLCWINPDWHWVEDFCRCEPCPTGSTLCGARACCGPNQTCDNGSCVDSCSAASGSHRARAAGACTCPAPGMILCKGTCVLACASDQILNQNTCACECLGESCGDRCCPLGERCVNEGGTDFPAVCCPKDRPACAGTCLGPGEKCCKHPRRGERACPSDAVCCFGIDGSGPGGCCRHGQKCQNGTRCVRKKKK